jgi:hypothetical protein
MANQRRIIPLYVNATLGRHQIRLLGACGVPLVKISARELLPQTF